MPLHADVTFVDRLRSVAAGPSGERGISFVGDADGDAVLLTYAELERRARALGAHLQALGLAGERALIAYPAGLGFVECLFGSLFAGVTAVPVYPPDALRFDGRLQAMERIARDSRAAALLAPAPVLDAVASSGLPGLSRLAMLDLAGAPVAAEAERWQDPGLRANTLALLQYTSGSESEPKGVCIDHANLVANARAIAETFGLDESSSSVSWLPPCHDMGLLGGILQPVFVGFPTVLMAPSVFLKRPARWLRAIAESRATISGGPNFAYELCVRRVPERVRLGLDLSSWRVAYCGAEPVQAATLDAFADAFAGSGFRREAFLACYGLAEATLLVSGTRAGSAPPRLPADGDGLESGRVDVAPPDGPAARTLVSCGRAPNGTDIRIVDPERRVAIADGQVGEIWVRGPGVARGYWGDEQASQRAFEACFEGETTPYLRTGDLGILRGGELYVTGRLKDLLILRGRNLYPQDIEATIASAHPAVRFGRAVAFPVTVGDDERLVVVAEVRRAALEAAAVVAEAIRSSVAGEHGVEPLAVLVLPPGSLPRTESGKPRRRACRTLFLDGRLGAAVVRDAAS